MSLFSPERPVVSEWHTPHEPGDIGAWEVVGRHLRWNKWISAMALDVLRELFQVKGGELIPSYIAVHVRHGNAISAISVWSLRSTTDVPQTCPGDFLTLACPYRLPDGPIQNGRHAYDPDRCLPLSAYALAVDSILAQMSSPLVAASPSGDHPFDLSTPPTQVVVTTDSDDPVFLEAIRKRGWKTVDREISERIRKERGDWYPMLIENVILSLGRGFVGTQGSTSRFYRVNLSLIISSILVNLPADD